MNDVMSKAQLSVNGKSYTYHDIQAVEKAGLGDVSTLPMTLKIVLENVLRQYAVGEAELEAVQAIATWGGRNEDGAAVPFAPARVLMQDFTGVPAVVDLAAMRNAMHDHGKDPSSINPQIPVDLVIDHSVQVDVYAKADAFIKNTEKEVQRNRERYQLLKWSQKSFDHLRVVPPGTGICHQVNLEHLAHVVQVKTQGGETLLLPDTLVGTDSHTTMINGLGVLGWGVGGIEAEAAMLGQSISIVVPEVVGFELRGLLQDGVTATDLVLTVTEMLRQHGVVGKFVEFYGDGLQALSLADRATIANMAPEYGATCGYFPVDQETLNYLSFTGRDAQQIAIVEAYCRAQGLWMEPGQAVPRFSATMSLDLGSIEPCMAGPSRPQDRVTLTQMPSAMQSVFEKQDKVEELDAKIPVEGEAYTLSHGDVVIAAITSCTNTSNPMVMMAAGLVAKKAVEKGLQVKPWVKTSLAPGSKVVTEYLQAAGLQSYLDQLGFQLVGYGCTTCIGNSGPLKPSIDACIKSHDLLVCSVLSGNRNFEGRIHPQVKASWLASPPLVVLHALVGHTRADLTTHEFGRDQRGEPIYLSDLWPSTDELKKAVSELTPKMFAHGYADVLDGDDSWKALAVNDDMIYDWDSASTYIRQPDFFEGIESNHGIESIEGARILALLGDSITTDHISPAGAIASDSPAGQYLQSKGVDPLDFNSYGSRRGNHEVMTRGTFANIRLRNEMTPEHEGGFTRVFPSKQVVSIYDAAMQYRSDGIPSVVIAGKEYGTGSSRDWAAKGSYMLGVRAVIAESFERIHRSNLVGMGILPLVFQVGVNRKSLALTGEEQIAIALSDDMAPAATVKVTITRANGESQTIDCLSRLDTPQDVAIYRNGGVLRHVLKARLSA